MIRLLICVFLIIPTLVAAQGVVERRAELAKIADRINDPDPLLRIAFFEEIVAKGDPVATQIAVKTALASNDGELKNIALRAYFQSTNQLEFAIAPPPGLEQRLQTTRQGSTERTQLGYHLRNVQDFMRLTGGLLVFQFDQADLSQGTFVVYSLNGQRGRNEQVKGNGSIRGGIVLFSSTIAPPQLRHHCSLQVKPSADLKLTGEMTCDQIGRFQAQADMY